MDFFFFANRLKVAPQIIHNREKNKKKLPWAVRLLQGATTGSREKWLCLSGGIILTFVNY